MIHKPAIPGAALLERFFNALHQNPTPRTWAEGLGSAGKPLIVAAANNAAHMTQAENTPVKTPIQKMSALVL
jgi:hypothetical protein